jgi:hypothetical protein
MNSFYLDTACQITRIVGGRGFSRSSRLYSLASQLRSVPTNG